MIIGMDIGNTSISLALLKKKSTKVLGSIATDTSARKLDQWVKSSLKNIDVESVYICSVVPTKTRQVQRLFSKKITVHIVGKDIMVPMVNQYTDQKQVGQDRLVTAYAAREMYAVPCIIIDFGTAITFDVVNAKGQYEGGIIVPGMQLSAQSLFAKTAMLPRIDQIKPPKQLVGKNTQDSILSGLFFGYGALCRGLIKDIRAHIEGSPKVIVTGGYTHVMKKYMGKQAYHINRNLVFEGLRLVAYISLRR